MDEYHFHLLLVCFLAMPNQCRGITAMPNKHKFKSQIYYEITHLERNISTFFKSDGTSHYHVPGKPELGMLASIHPKAKISE